MWDDDYDNYPNDPNYPDPDGDFHGGTIGLVTVYSETYSLNLDFDFWTDLDFNAGWDFLCELTTKYEVETSVTIGPQIGGSILNYGTKINLYSAELANMKHENNQVKTKLIGVSRSTKKRQVDNQIIKITILTIIFRPYLYLLFTQGLFLLAL